MARFLSTTAATASLLAVVACTFFAASADAQSTDERARLHFDSGTAYFDAGDYEDALREFENAYELSERPELLYNLYLCHERLGHLDQAATSLEAFLRDGDPGERRDVLEQRLANIRERAASGSDASDGATVDEDPEPENDPYVDPGPQPEDAAGGGMPTPAIVAFSVGGAGAVTWAIFGILAASESGNLSETCMSGCTEDQVSNQRTYNLIADIGFGVTLAGAAAGVLLWLLLDGDSEDDTDRASATTITPYFDPSGGGLVARGTL